MNTIQLLLYLLGVLKVEGFSPSLFPMPVYKTSLSKAAVGIVEKFYTLRETHLNVLSASSGDQIRTMYLVNEILYHFRGIIKCSYFNDMMARRLGSSSNNLIIIDDYRSFQKIYRKLESGSIDFTGYFLIVISSNLGNRMASVLENIFKDCFSRYIVNVNVLIARSNSISDIIDMYTYFPFTEHNCHCMKPVLYDTFENGTFATDLSIFPSKTSNFFGCPITVVTWHYPPHMILHYSRAGKRMSYQGIDGNILRVLVEKMNFSLKFDLTGGHRGNVYWNGTATGALQVILDGRGNITICSAGFIFAQSTKTSASVNYLPVGLLFAMPSLGCYSSFEKLFLIFRWGVWSSTFGVYAIAVCVIHFSKKIRRNAYHFIAGKDNYSPYFNLISVTTGIPIPKPPKRNFARYLFILWTLATFVIRSSYQGSLFDYLQKTEEREGSHSLIYFLEQGYTLYVPEDCLPWFDHLPEIKAHLKGMNKSIWSYFDDMQDPAYKGIILTTGIQIAYYNTQFRKIAHIRSLEERLFYLPQSMFYPKHSYLLYPINEILNDCVSGGLIENWVQSFLGNRPSSFGTMHKPISHSHLHGFFLAIIGLYTTAFGVFLFEVLSYNGNQSNQLKQALMQGN